MVAYAELSRYDHGFIRAVFDVQATATEDFLTRLFCFYTSAYNYLEGQSPRSPRGADSLPLLKKSIKQLDKQYSVLKKTLEVNDWNLNY